MHTNLDDATWSAIAAQYVYTLRGYEPDGFPMEVGSATTQMFAEFFDSETARAAHPDDVPYVLFDHALEVGFRIAVATLTLMPDEATAKIASLVEEARLRLHSVLEYERVPA